MAAYSIPETMAMTNLRCVVVSANPGHVFLVGEEVIIKVANILWMRQLDGGIIHLEMINGLEMEVGPIGPIL